MWSRNIWKQTICYVYDILIWTDFRGYICIVTTPGPLFSLKPPTHFFFDKLNAIFRFHETQIQLTLPAICLHWSRQAVGLYAMGDGS